MRFFMYVARSIPALLFFFFVTHTLRGQQPITHAQVVISTDKGRPDVFPIFKSTTKPRVAATINKVLQMVSFNHINIDKNPTAYSNDESYATWTYTVDYSNPKLLFVKTSHFFPKQSMNTPDHTEDIDFLFDTATGDRIFPWDFITTDGLVAIKEILKERVDAMVRERYVSLRKRYPLKTYPEALPNLDASIERINGDINNTIPYFVNLPEKSFSFSYWWSEDGDAETVPELEDPFTVTFSGDELKPYASTAWTYYVTRTSKVAPASDAISHVWTGMLGDKIPVTWTIRRDGENISGVEVYDKHGATITLTGGAKDNVFWLDEIDENGEKVGVFEFSSSKGKLTGIWKKADGSKSLPFKAVIGAGVL